MAAPELRLNVTLDLVGFRAEIQKLVITAQQDFKPQLSVELSLDDVNFKQKLKDLEKIKPVITIGDSQLIAARTRIGTLNKSLATLRRATATPIAIKVKYVEEGKPPTGAISKSGTFRQRLTGLDTEPIKQLYAAAGKAGIVQFDAEIAKNKGKIITALNQAGESSVTGLLNGLKSKDSAVKTAAKSLGDILIAALKLSLQIQSPSKKMEAIGEDAGEGFNKGLKESLSEAKDSAVSKMRELVATLRIEAAKIQNISLAPGSLRGASAPASLRGAPSGGRGYFNSIGPLPEGSKEPYTMTDRGYQPYLGGPGVGSSAAPRGLLPPASAIGRGSHGQSFAGAPINFSMGAFPQLPPSGTANQLRQQARVAQAHLRSAERSVAVFGERAAMLDKAMSAFRTSGRATGYTSPIGPLPRDSAEPYAAGSRGMFGKEGFEARLESRPIAGLLSPSSTPTREQIIAMRQKIARQRSDARALDVQLEDRLRPTVPPRQYFQPNTQPLLPGSGGALARSSAIVPYGALALRGGGGGLPPGGGGNVPPRPPSGGGGNVPGGGKTYTIIFATNASKAAQAIQKVQDELTKVIKIGSPVDLTLDTSNLASGINKTFKELDKEINKAQRKLNKLQIGSPAFNRRAEQLGLSEGQRERGQNILEARKAKAQAQAFEGGSEIRLQKTLQALRLEASQIKPNTIEWVKLQQQIGAINFDLQKADKLAENIQLREQLGAFSPGSLAFLETKLTMLRNKAREISPDTAGWKQLNKEIQTIEGSIAKANKKPLGGGQRLGAAGGAFLYGGGLGGGAGSAIGGIAGGLLGGVPGAFTGAALGQAADDLGRMTSAMVEQATVVKKLQLGLASASNSFGDFAAANKEVKRISDSLLIPLEDTYRKFTQLRASTVALGIDTKTTGEIFEGTAAAVLKSGGSMDDVSGAMRAVVQVFSKGKLTAEELRGQLAERLPGAVVEFAESAGMSVQQLDKEFEAGTTTLDDFVKFLRKKSKESADFTKEMAVGSEYAGRRMEKAFEKVQISIGQAFQPTGAAFQDFATGVISLLDKMIEKAIKFKLLQPGSDFYEAKAINEGTAGIENLENELSKARQNQKKLGKEIESVGPLGAFIGIGPKETSREYKVLTDEITNMAKALQNIRKLEKLTKQREEQEKKRLADEKLASGMLNAIEQREESLGKARENYEENIANIRENAVKQAQDLEKKYQDQRLQAERTLAKIRRDLATSEESFGFIRRQQEAGLTGEDPEVINAAKRGAEIIRTYTEEKIRIEEESQDRQIALSKELENFKRTNADAINQANERYAKSIGEIQRAYAKSVAKLIEEGSNNGAKRLVAAGKLINELTKQSIAQKAISSKVQGGVEPLGVDQYKAGEMIYSAKVILDKAKISEQTNNPTFKGLYQLVLQLVQATNNIAQAEKVLASSLSAATSASPVITSTVNTRDLDQRVESSQNKLKQIGNQADSSLNALNKQENVRNQLVEEFAAESKNSTDALNASRKQNNLLVERLKLIRNGVLPALAEEKAERDAMDILEIDKITGLKRSAMASSKEPEIQQLITKEFETQVRILRNQRVERDKLLQQSRDNLALVEAATIKSEASFAGAGLKAGYTGEAGAAYRQKLMEGVSPDVAAGVANATNQLKINRETVEALEASISSLGDSFSEVFKGIVNQTLTGQQALSSLQQGFQTFFQSIGDYFMQMVAKMIFEWGKTLVIKGLSSILSMFNPAAAAGAAVTGVVPGLSDLNAPANINNPLGVMGAANGAVWKGGFTAFAAGGIVQGPTLGLVGEGKYNEAIIPLPDGKSVPVDLGGMSDGLGNNITSNIVVNVNSDGQSTSNANGSNSVDLGRKIEGAVKQVIVAELRPGGVLAGRR